MMAQNELAAGMFAFFLNRDAKEEVGGELSIGGVDPDRYEGSAARCSSKAPPPFFKFLDSTKVPFESL